MAIPSIDELVSNLNLQPHGNGGYFKETHRDEFTLSKDLPKNSFADDRSRSCSTAIIVLLPSKITSKMHRVKSDETYHYYLGTSPLQLDEFDPSTGEHRQVIMGQDVSQGQKVQHTIKKNIYWASRAVDQTQENGYVLFGATVSPGFDFEDFETPSAAQMGRLFPQYDAELFKEMCSKKDD